MNNFDSIIFDVDGTMWDSTEVAADAYNEVFEREGMDIRVTGNDLKKLFGKPMDVIFQTILPDIDHETAVRLGNECMDLENKTLAKTGADYYPEIVETFRALSSKIPVFIVSNCQCGYIEVVMHGAHLEPYVTDHLCFGDTGTSKGQTIRTLMKKYGLKHSVYVGDIQGDADACEEAGIPVIYAAYGFGTIREPYAVIHELKELRTLFDC